MSLLRGRDVRRLTDSDLHNEIDDPSAQFFAFGFEVLRRHPRHPHESGKPPRGFPARQRHVPGWCTAGVLSSQRAPGWPSSSPSSRRAGKPMTRGIRSNERGVIFRTQKNPVGSEVRYCALQNPDSPPRRKVWHPGRGSTRGGPELSSRRLRAVSSLTPAGAVRSRRFSDRGCRI